MFEKIRDKILGQVSPEKINELLTDMKNKAGEYVPDFKLSLKVKNTSKHANPEYATDGASGFDLRANLGTTMKLEPGDIKLIPTGLFFDIPSGFEIQVRSRSGLALKHGVAVLNSPGTIDSDYTGECGVILVNHSKTTFEINDGDRIAQGVFSPVLGKSWVSIDGVTDITKETDRNSGGFGSTGAR